MISRVWHGWTVTDNADAYEELLRKQVFPGIVARKIRGFRRIELFRRPLGDEVEFITVMWFTSLAAVKAFAGEDHETAVVPAAAQALLKRYDPASQHYDVRVVRET